MFNLICSPISFILIFKPIHNKLLLNDTSIIPTLFPKNNIKIKSLSNYFDISILYQCVVHILKNINIVLNSILKWRPLDRSVYLTFSNGSLNLCWSICRFCLFHFTCFAYWCILLIHTYVFLVWSLWPFSSFPFFFWLLKKKSFCK